MQDQPKAHLFTEALGGRFSFHGELSHLAQKYAGWGRILPHTRDSYHEQRLDELAPYIPVEAFRTPKEGKTSRDTMKQWYTTNGMGPLIAVPSAAAALGVLGYGIEGFFILLTYIGGGHIANYSETPFHGFGLPTVGIGAIAGLLASKVFATPDPSAQRAALADAQKLDKLIAEYQAEKSTPTAS